MTVIVKSMTSFDIIQINDVSNIAYDDATQIYTITTSGGVSTTYSGESYYVYLI